MDNTIRNIEALISKQREQIDTLEELKRALIHEHQNRMKNTDAVISFTAHELELFKVVYNEARRFDRKSFMFKDNELLTGFAKYVIEFMDQKV